MTEASVLLLQNNTIYMKLTTFSSLLMDFRAFFNQKEYLQADINHDQYFLLISINSRNMITTFSASFRGKNRLISMDLYHITALILKIYYRLWGPESLQL